MAVGGECVRLTVLSVKRCEMDLKYVQLTVGLDALILRVMVRSHRWREVETVLSYILAKLYSAGPRVVEYTTVKVVVTILS